MNRLPRSGSLVVASVLFFLFFLYRPTTFSLLNRTIHPNATDAAPSILAPTNEKQTPRHIGGRWISVRASLGLSPLPETIAVPILVNITPHPNTSPTRPSFKSRIRIDLRRRGQLLPEDGRQDSHPILRFAPESSKAKVLRSTETTSAFKFDSVAKSSDSSSLRRVVYRQGMGAGRGKARRVREEHS